MRGVVYFLILSPFFLLGDAGTTNGEVITEEASISTEHVLEAVYTASSTYDIALTSAMENSPVEIEKGVNKTPIGKNPTSSVDGNYDFVD